MLRLISLCDVGLINLDGRLGLQCRRRRESNTCQAGSGRRPLHEGGADEVNDWDGAECAESLSQRAGMAIWARRTLLGRTPTAVVLRAGGRVGVLHSL